MKLPRLTDHEYGQAERLARKVPLDQCPTCKARPRIVPGSGGATELIPGTYRLWGKEHKCNCKAQIELRIHYLVANIPTQYMRLDWDADYDGSEVVSKAVNQYLGNFGYYDDQGLGLEFGGPLGVGKTFAATHIGKELVKRGKKVYFLPFVEMVSAFEQQGGEEIEKRLRDTHVVILDEILPAEFGERQRALYAIRLEALVRYRTNFDLPTIITTNMSQAKLNDQYPRIYSLLSAKQLRVEVTGEDARGRVGKENIELMENGETRPIT